MTETLSLLRNASRSLARTPGFSFTIIITIAIAIGVNTAVFTVLNSVLVRPLPYSIPEQLVFVTYRSQDPNLRGNAVPTPPLFSWINKSREIAGWGVYHVGQLTLLTPAGEPVQLQSGSVSADFFGVLGASEPLLGRYFIPDEGRPGGRPVAIVSAGLWRQRFGSDTRLVGQTIKLNGLDRTLVGVLADNFRFPDSSQPQVLVPLTLDHNSRVVRFVSVIGRLAARSSPLSAETELNNILKTDAHTFPPAVSSLSGSTVAVTDLHRYIAGDMYNVLPLSLGTTMLVLLLACANVTSLTLARNAKRRREMAVRVALGANASSLARSILAEMCVLCITSTIFAVLMLYALLGGLRRLLSTTLPVQGVTQLDATVLAFSACVMFATIALCSMIPVTRLRLQWKNAGVDLAARSGTRTTPADSAQHILVIGQVATAFILLIGSLLLINTLWQLSRAPIGFVPTQLLTFKVSAIGRGTPDARRVAMLDEMISRIRAHPEVSAIASGTSLPLDGHTFEFVVPIEGLPAPSPSEPLVPVNLISAGYFKALGAQVLQGREFNESDSGTSPKVAMVNEAFVRAKSLGENAVGRRLSLGGSPQDARVSSPWSIAIVGVVENVRDRHLTEDSRPAIYRPFSQAAPQMGWYTATFVVRTRSNPQLLVQPLRQHISTIAPSAVVYDIATMDERLGSSVAPERQRAILFALFAGVGVSLATIGIYCLLAYSVASSIREFGVRLAVGASPSDVFRLVIQKGIVPAVLGILAGTIGAAFLTRFLAGFLYNVHPVDPATYAIAAAGMLGLATIASLAPARRAMRTNPAILLKEG